MKSVSYSGFDELFGLFWTAVMEVILSNHLIENTIFIFPSGRYDADQVVRRQRAAAIG